MSDKYEKHVKKVASKKVIQIESNTFFPNAFRGHFQSMKQLPFGQSSDRYRGASDVIVQSEKKIVPSAENDDIRIIT